jgi:hypothetical protein
MGDFKAKVPGRQNSDGRRRFGFGIESADKGSPPEGEVFIGRDDQAGSTEAPAGRSDAKGGLRPRTHRLSG